MSNVTFLYPLKKSEYLSFFRRFQGAQKCDIGLKWVKIYLKLIITETTTEAGSIKKRVLRNFAKFTGKHLCQSLFFNKVVGHSNFLIVFLFLFFLLACIIWLCFTFTMFWFSKLVQLIHLSNGLWLIKFQKS